MEGEVFFFFLSFLLDPKNKLYQTHQTTVFSDWFGAAGVSLQDFTFELES